MRTRALSTLRVPGSHAVSAQVQRPVMGACSMCTSGIPEECGRTARRAVPVCPVSIRHIESVTDPGRVHCSFKEEGGWDADTTDANEVREISSGIPEYRLSKLEH